MSIAPPSRRTLAVTITVVIVIITIGAVTRQLRADTTDVPTMVVDKSTFVNTLDVRGEIRPVRSVVLTAPSTGGSDLQIINLAPNGSTVKTGDLVIQFDTTAPQRTLDQRTSDLQTANAEVAKVEAEGRRRIEAAEATLAELRSIAARARLDLSRRELVSAIEAEKFELAFSDAEHRVEAQAAKLEGERRATAADLSIARQKRDKAAFDVADTERVIASLSMKSPGDGQLSLMPNFRNAQFSRTAPEFKRGDRAWFGAAIAELPDLTAVRMSCRVDEADRARVAVDARVRVRVDALPDRELPGSIESISIVAKPDFTSFPPTRNFDLSVSLSDTDARIRSGMSATAIIELDQLPDVIVIPDSAVFLRDGQSIVYAVDGRSIQPRPVTIARRSRDRVAITAGLSAGERIAMRDPTLEAAR
jgi:multidrug efflux pump subunit AcrA (membrane-fusion protein)